MSNVVGTPQNWFRRILNLAAMALVLWDLATRVLRGAVPVWIAVCVLAAVVAWFIVTVVHSRTGRIQLVCLAVMMLGGGLAACYTDGVGIAPIVVAILVFSRDLARPVWLGVAFVLATMTCILVGAVIHPTAWLGLVSIEAGVAIAFFGGLSRRQFLLADARARQLVGEQARADVMASRQQLAHDIHDVLAHSLGGLVIQLDAVDALLEAGDTKAAAARVRDSRALAAEGLSEARRAVAALSEVPDEGRLDAGEVLESLRALLGAHRSLGGTVDFDETGAAVSVSAQLGAALRRALQESLTKARKHAPGESVVVRLAWKSGTVTLTISNRVADGSASSSGGHGLVGMRKRFAAVPGGFATAEAQAGSFVVCVGGETS